MAYPARKLQPNEAYYTYADYLSWDDGDHTEIVSGIPILFAAPSPRHQEVLLELAAQLREFLRGKPCKVYPAPFAVRLFQKERDRPRNVDTVVEPDISVVCDKSKLDKSGCKGAPDFIIEILSPSTKRHDRERKFALYQTAGVREYWIVDPENNTVETYVLREGGYEAESAAVRGGKIPVAVLDGCIIDLDLVFAE